MQRRWCFSHISFVCFRIVHKRQSRWSFHFLHRLHSAAIVVHGDLLTFSVNRPRFRRYLLAFVFLRSTSMEKSDIIIEAYYFATASRHGWRFQLPRPTGTKADGAVSFCVQLHVQINEPTGGGGVWVQWKEVWFFLPLPPFANSCYNKIFLEHEMKNVWPLTVPLVSGGWRFSSQTNSVFGVFAVYTCRNRKSWWMYSVLTPMIIVFAKWWRSDIPSLKKKDISVRSNLHLKIYYCNLWCGEQRNDSSETYAAAQMLSITLKRPERTLELSGR